MGGTDMLAVLRRGSKHSPLNISMRSDIYLQDIPTWSLTLSRDNIAGKTFITVIIVEAGCVTETNVVYEQICC